MIGEHIPTKPTPVEAQCLTCDWQGRLADAMTLTYASIPCCPRCCDPLEVASDKPLMVVTGAQFDPLADTR